MWTVGWYQRILEVMVIGQAEVYCMFRHIPQPLQDCVTLINTRRLDRDAADDVFVRI